MLLLYFIIFIIFYYTFIIFYFIIYYYILLYFYYILLYFIIFYYILLYFIIYYYILLYFIIFYYLLLYFIIFYYILLYFIIFLLLCLVIPGVPGRLHVLDRSPFVVTLKWESPFDGGTPILRYRVEYGVFGRNEWHQETTVELRHTVRDLEPKTKYEVRISAVNAVGLGPYAVVMTTTFGLF